MARPRAEQVKEQRKQRIKFGDPRLRMTIDPATDKRFKSEGLVPRWVNDDGKGRIDQLKMRGYEFVSDPNNDIQAGEGGNTDMGTSVSKIVGTTKDGKPLRAYLMIQRQEDYQEDQGVKEEINMKVDEAIRRGEPGGPQQTAVKEKGGGTYVKAVEYQP